MGHKFRMENKDKLENCERKGLFNWEEALISLGIQPAMNVADIGCGIGFLTLMCSKIVGDKGKVYAIDISKEMLDETRERIKAAGRSNVETILSEENNIPLDDKSMDFCLAVFVLHEVDDVSLFVKEMGRILKDDGLIGVIEWKKVPSPMGPPLEERIPEEDMGRIFNEKGFVVKKIFPLGIYNYGMVICKKEKIVKNFESPVDMIDSFGPIIDLVKKKHIREVEKEIAQLALVVSDMVERGEVSAQWAADYFGTLDLLLEDEKVWDPSFSSELSDLLFEGMHFQDYGTEYEFNIMENIRSLAEKILTKQRS